MLKEATPAVSRGTGPRVLNPFASSTVDMSRGGGCCVPAGLLSIDL